MQKCLTARAFTPQGVHLFLQVSVHSITAVVRLDAYPYAPSSSLRQPQNSVMRRNTGGIDGTRPPLGAAGVDTGKGQTVITNLCCYSIPVANALMLPGNMSVRLPQKVHVTETSAAALLAPKSTQLEEKISLLLRVCKLYNALHRATYASPRNTSLWRKTKVVSIGPGLPLELLESTPAGVRLYPLVERVRAYHEQGFASRVAFRRLTCPRPAEALTRLEAFARKAEGKVMRRFLIYIYVRLLVSCVGMISSCWGCLFHRVNVFFYPENE